MLSPKHVTVVTTSDLGELKIIKHLKPVSAHVVAGTNVFSDLAASFTDFFGGRSGSYQKQLSSLYDEAIERIKVAAFEIGANCVLGLKVDIDEISGKGKAMFMITAVGTAAIAEAENKNQTSNDFTVKLENVSIDKINILERKNKVLQESNLPDWKIDDDLWDFITDNQIDEVFPALVNKYKVILVTNIYVDAANNFYKRMVSYLNNFPDDKKSDMLFFAVFKEIDKKVAGELSNIIRELQLLDLKLVLNMLLNGELENQKKAMLMLTFDKKFYNKEDLADLHKIKEIIIDRFKETGTISTKKQLLSSKEKDVWICNCGQSNEMESVYCSKCQKNIYGFTVNELSPDKAIKWIDQKLSLISHFIA